MNLTLRERIDKSIVQKLINAKVNFGLGAPIKNKKKPKIYCRGTLQTSHKKISKKGSQCKGNR